MAAIEDLIRQIADPRLRDHLASEVAKLKNQKKFGLVFEDHLPELLRLPQAAATVGMRVVRKDEKDNVTYRVTAEVNGKWIKAVPESGGPEEKLERSAVVVARAFGEAMIVAQAIELKKESPAWDGHLFVDDNGKFGWAPKTWEKLVVDEERQRAGFAGFFRNVDRKDWALCIPHGAEEDKAMFPDLLVFRRAAGDVLIDIFEPHGDQFADHLSKAKGMANYARKHGGGFGRIEMIRFVGTGQKRQRQGLDMKDDKIRSKVLNANTPEQLMTLYEELG